MPGPGSAAHRPRPRGPAGGPELLDANRGKDISELFEGGAGGHDHSRAARMLLERYYVGDLVPEGGAALPTDPESEKQRILAAQAAAVEGVVDESKGLLSQVGRGEGGGGEGGAAEQAPAGQGRGGLLSV